MGNQAANGANSRDGLNRCPGKRRTACKLARGTPMRRGIETDYLNPLRNQLLDKRKILGGFAAPSMNQ
jgi:hypothetical protein